MVIETSKDGGLIDETYEPVSPEQLKKYKNMNDDELSAVLREEVMALDE